MRHHFADVLLVHEAVVRGDLLAVRPPALRLAAVAMPERMPETAAPFVAEIRKAGQRAADATTLAAAAQATVAMATGCAKCHRGVGVFPAPSRPAGPDIGGLLGHMLEHQRAADDMLIGLMVPSTADWRQGADRLRAATLLPRQFPKDPNLTKEIRKLDLRVHEMSDQAIEAETPDERANAYTALLGTCAPCHSLHSKIWGPGRSGGAPQSR
jgi:cytochrome c553